MNVIEFDKVSFGFGDRPILHDITFQIRETEVFGLIGRSGCGKTTTLRLISGLHLPNSGVINVFGRRATDYAGLERCVATVWQSRALFPHLSVLDNIKFGMRLRRLDLKEQTRRLNEVVELLRLGDLLSRGIGKLSGGEQQRVALARALVVLPKILLLDEPFTGLDQELKLQVQEDLRRLVRSLNITYVLVSQAQEDVFSLADQVAVLERGEISQIASPIELYRRPANAFIAKFVGRRNVIPGTVREIRNDGRIADIFVGPEEGLWTATNRDGIQPNGPVFYVIGPEDIRLDQSGTCKVRASLRGIEMLGSFEVLYLRLRNGINIQVQCQLRNSGFVDPPTPGDAMWISWNTDDAFALRRDATGTNA